MKQIIIFLLSLTLFNCSTMDEPKTTLTGKWAKSEKCPNTAYFDFSAGKIYVINNNCQQIGSSDVEYTINGGTVTISINNEPEMIRTGFTLNDNSFSWMVGDIKEEYIRVK